MFNEQPKLRTVSRLWTALQKVFAHLFGYDIFISYRRADGTSYAVALQQELSKHFVVFRDETDIDYGEEFPSLLKQRISRCQMLLVVVTKKALENDSWVLKEVGMRLDASRRRFIGLFPRKSRIVPIYFDGILPENIQGSDSVVTAIRESNGEQANGDAWDLLGTSENVARTFGTLRLRKKIILGACASVFGVLLAAIAMLISGSSPYLWGQLDRPLAGSEYDERWIQPISDVAVSRTDPNHILYLGEVSMYDEKSDSGYLVPHLISTIGKDKVEVDGVAVSSLSSLEEILSRLKGDDTWVTTSADPTTSYASDWDLPFEGEFRDASDPEKVVLLSSRLKDAFPSASDPEQLASLLSSLYWNSGFAELSFSSREAKGWTLEVFKYHWWEPIQGHYMGNDESNDVAIRFGQNGAWALVEIDNVLGIWPLGTTADSALLLTSEKGFYWTHDSGVNWESANFGETGFTDGVRVKPVVAGKEIFAYIDRGNKDNPLYRLRQRGLFERLRVGIVKMLGG